MSQVRATALTTCHKVWRSTNCFCVLDCRLQARRLRDPPQTKMTCTLLETLLASTIALTGPRTAAG